MRSTTKAKIGVAGLGAIALSLVATMPAYADYEPGPGDIVAVGGDTPQFDLQFIADGDTQGDQGFNSTTPTNRLVTFNATADGNARSAYTSSATTGTASVPLNPTDVLRAGTFPVQRVQSSGAAITALLADTANPEVINFVFSASEPTAAQQTTAGNEGFGFLHVVEIGTDSVQIAADKASTNAPNGLSPADLLNIYTGVYTTWSQVPGNSSGSHDTIIPLLPPTGSSINKTFLADLKTANGNVTPTLSASVKTVEQNDPSAITGASNPADAIVPFSSARLALWSSGFFHDPSVVFPGSNTALNPGIKLLTGTPGDGSVYNTSITHYVIFRQSDATSTTPMEPGGTKNWVKTLFSNPGGTTPFVATGGGQALIQAAGTTPNYVDLGNVSSG